MPVWGLLVALVGSSDFRLADLFAPISLSAFGRHDRTFSCVNAIKNLIIALALPYPLYLSLGWCPSAAPRRGRTSRVNAAVDPAADDGGRGRCGGQGEPYSLSGTGIERQGGGADGDAAAADRIA
jgi:hypothetical protein